MILFSIISYFLKNWTLRYINGYFLTHKWARASIINLTI